MFTFSFTSCARNSTEQMLRQIRSACGIFMSDEQYTEIVCLPEPCIRILFNNRDKLHDLVFFFKNDFKLLIALQSENMHIFFSTTNSIGPCNHPGPLLSRLYQKQQAEHQHPAIAVACYVTDQAIIPSHDQQFFTNTQQKQSQPTVARPPTSKF